MSDISGNPNPIMRLDTSRAAQYTAPEAPKVSFGTKLGRFFGKTMSVLGPIGGAVAAVALPGIGIPIAMAAFGASKFSGDMVNKSYQKEGLEIQAQQQQIAQMQVTTPGLFEQDNEGGMATNFIAPSELMPSIQNTVVDRELSRGSALGSF